MHEVVACLPLASPSLADHVCSKSSSSLCSGGHVCLYSSSSISLYIASLLLPLLLIFSQHCEEERSMAPSFGRSISLSPFTLSPPRRSSSSSFNKSKGSKAVRHVRSISLPTSRTHPLLAHLQHNIRAVRAWAAQPVSPSSGLAHIEALHSALAELLLLPEARAAVKVDCLLLDGFLALADAYGSFQDAVLDLKLHAADVQAALRRCDAARLSSAVRAQRQAEKDIARIASSSSMLAASFCKIVDADQMSGLLAQAVACIASASAAVFSAVEFTSKTAAASSSSKKSTFISLVKRRASPASSNEDKHLHRLQDLDDCIAQIQDATDKVFRTILNTRVALLNIQTQTC